MKANRRSTVTHAAVLSFAMATVIPPTLGAQSNIAKWQSTAGYRVQYHDTVLTSGLRVLVVPQDFAPMVAITLMLRVGSRDDPPDRVGMAHLLEHLAGDPSLAASRKVGGWAPSGYLPGFTGFSMTGYTARTSTANLEAAIADFADLLQHEHISDMGMEVGWSGTVSEHAQGVFNQPYGLSSLCVWDVYWRGLTHCRDAKEIEKQIRAASLEDLRQLFRSRYRADQAVLVLVGDVQPDRAVHLASRYVSSAPAEAASARLAAAPSTARPPIHLVIDDRLATATRVDLAYRTSTGESPDFAALVVLHELLFGSQSAMVSRILVDELRFATRVGSGEFGFPGSSYPASMHISVTPLRATAADSVEPVLQESIRAIVREQLTPELVERAKSRAARVFIDVTRGSGPEGLAYMLAVLGTEQHPARINDWLAELGAVTLADVQAVGRRYFEPRAQVLVRTIPTASAAPRGQR